jgi:ATP-dependent phosphoenolpyruvate carboxykinase
LPATKVCWPPKGKHTGRSAKDKFIVRDAETENSVMVGQDQRRHDPGAFRRAEGRFPRGAGAKDKLYVADLFGGSQPEHRVNVRVINELAWHNLFIRTCWSARAANWQLRARIHDHRPAQLRPIRPATAAAAKR